MKTRALSMDVDDDDDVNSIEAIFYGDTDLASSSTDHELPSALLPFDHITNDAPQSSGATSNTKRRRTGGSPVSSLVDVDDGEMEDIDGEVVDGFSLLDRDGVPGHLTVAFVQQQEEGANGDDDDDDGPVPPKLMTHAELDAFVSEQSLMP